jgi:hypothetical protein
MHSGHTIRQTRAIVAVSLVLLLGSTVVRADRILVIGDSVAAPLAPELQTVLHENGHSDITVDATPFIGQSWQMRTTARLNDISEWLNERPDTIVVHMSIGGNDWGSSDWTPSWAGTAEERNMISGINRNVGVVIDHIFSLRPDIQILWQGSDFPRPYSRGTPLQINTFLITWAEQRAQFAATRPGLSFVDLNGTLQVAYGFDGIQHTEFDPGFVIPPGDPSLPDPGLPGPYEAYIPNEPFHQTPEGHKVLAQAQYDLFYEPLLNGRDFQINPGLNDAWYSPATEGQGFLISVFPDIKEMFVAWFTFDTERPPDDATALLGEPGHRWLTAQGPYEGDTANLTLFLTEGGVFDSAEPLPETDPAGDGTIMIEFADCTEGLMNYEITSLDIAGEIPIQRIALDNVALCQSLEEQLHQK